jgi:hypothetical protein
VRHVRADLPATASYSYQFGSRLGRPERLLSGLNEGISTWTPLQQSAIPARRICLIPTVLWSFRRH